MDLFLKQFTKLKETIENDDVEAMKNIMRVSTRNRSYFDKYAPRPKGEQDKAA